MTDKAQTLPMTEQVPTPTPWSYHQDKYDDWGWIHGPDGSLAAIARSSGEYDADEHRRNGTDPYGANARLIVEAVNSYASLKARIVKMERALNWIVNSPSAHPANMVKVAEAALQPQDTAND